MQASIKFMRLDKTTFTLKIKLLLINRTTLQTKVSLSEVHTTGAVAGKRTDTTDVSSDPTTMSPEHE